MNDDRIWLAGALMFVGGFVAGLVMHPAALLLGVGLIGAGSIVLYRRNPKDATVGLKIGMLSFVAGGGGLLLGSMLNRAV